MSSGAMPGAKYALYVEDEITRRYLNTLEPNRKLVDICVVGGCERVFGCLEDDFRSGVKNSLGVVDRDFDRQAKLGWRNTDTGKSFYCLPAHEIENYLLDFDIIAEFKCPGIDPKKPASHWRAVARTVAEGYLYSIAYNQVLADVQREYLTNYPKHIQLSSGPGSNFTANLPGEQIQTEASLVAKLQNEGWLATAGAHAGKLFAPDVLKQKAEDAVAYYQNLLNGADADWIRGFPGKEMYRAITNCMSMSDEQWLDLARFVAEQQRENGNVPKDMTDLLAKLSQ